MSKILRLGLLVADEPAPELLKENGDYVHMFTKLFEDAAGALNVQVKLTPFQVVRDQFPTQEQLGDFDAFVITGAKYSAYDDLPWIQRLKALVKELITDHPQLWVFGICFGHQVIAEAMNGKVSKNPRGWEVGWTEIELNQRGQEILATERGSFAIHQMHQDEVSKVPENFQVLASTPVCACQVMILPGRSLSIQAHPEFKSQYVKGLVKMRTEKKIFTPQQHDTWMQVVDRPADGIWFAKKCLSLLLGAVTKE